MKTSGFRRKTVFEAPAPLATLLALVTAAGRCTPGASDNVDMCGDSKAAVHRLAIRNGTDSPETVTLTPAQIKSVGEIKIGGNGYYTTCSATLVAPNVVLTAGHCLDDPDTEYIAFNSGEDYLNPDHTFLASGWHMHPSYPGGGSGPRYDIGVVILGEDATLQGLAPIPVNLHARSLAGQTVQLAGYGRIDPAVSGNTVRHWTTMPVVEEDGLLYAADGQGVTGICIGDSGGPMLWEIPGKGVHVMGVASNGNSSTCTGITYYPRTDAVTDFLSGYVPADPCGDETAQGRCDGNTAVWCDGQAVQTQTCDDFDLVCKTGADGSSRCRPPDPVVPDEPDDECTRLGRDGECLEMNGRIWARWCENDSIRVRDCTACDQTCGWVGTRLGFYCM